MSRARRASCFVAEEVGHVLLKNYMESCEDANYVISPVSVFIAMSMLKHGADGSTKDQLERALLVSPHTHGNEARHVLSVLLPSSDSLVAMSTTNANGLFLQEGIEPALSFVTDMRRIFHASVESAKFGSLEGEQKINHWIERESLGKMKDSLTDTSEDDIMALINIVLLRGRWKEVFKKADTIHSNFHVSPEKTVKAEIMRQRGVFRYVRKEIERFTVVFLPYRRKSEPAWEMGILVPDEGLNPIDYLKQLQPDALKKLRSEMEDETLVVHVPKFKSESFIDLKRYIMQMGAISPFTEHAEFPGICDSTPLSVSRIYQKCSVEIDEEGTDAENVTAICDLRRKSLAKAESIDFMATSPFLFFVYQPDSGIMLFCGRVTDPTV